MSHSIYQSNMQPFQLSLYLRTPIAYLENPIMLDSILMYAASRRIRGHEALDQNHPDTFIEIPLPLKKTATYYHASMGIIEGPSTLGTTEIVKKWTGETSVDTMRGWSRQYLERITYVSTPFISFYGYGDIVEVRTLMESITHIGKNSRMGYGSVHDIEITPLDKDVSIISSEGLLQRPVDIESWDSDMPANAFVTAMPVIPPYWGNNRVLAYCPKPHSWILDNETTKNKELKILEWYEDDDL